MKRIAILAAGALALGGAQAQTKWDMPTPYPPTNLHTENILQFVADVEKGSGGKLKIQVHPGASLFKAPEIKRAVQTGQVQAAGVTIVGGLSGSEMVVETAGPFLNAGQLVRPKKVVSKTRTLP
mgnify:CR=1 FL=1